MSELENAPIAGQTPDTAQQPAPAAPAPAAKGGKKAG